MRENRLYILVILLCLGVVALVVAALRQEQTRTWRWYQAEFIRRTKADLPARLERVSDEKLRADMIAAADRIVAEGIELRQIYVPELGQVSRCVSCHEASTEPLVARTEFPWKRHPEPYLEAHWHPFEQYGCVVCHGGNGRATEATAAHGEEGVGEMPRRKDEFAQAACGKCHRASEIDGAPAWNRGRYLAEDRGCSGCHDFGEAIAATRTGPPLTGLGSKTSEDWLVSWLMQPEAFRPRTRMPRPRLDAREAAAIARVLLAERSQRVDAVAGYLKAAARMDWSRSERRGRELAEGASGCTTCHDWPRLKRRGFHPVPGWRMIGPDLDRSGNKMTLPYVAALLADPQTVMPGTMMPQFEYPESDRLGIAAFVVGLGSSRNRPAREEAAASPTAAERELATAAMNRLGCAACHGGQGPQENRIGPVLADVADRRYWQVQWYAADVPVDERHLERYLQWKLEGSPQVDNGDDGRLRMPEYRLSQHERRSLAAYLLSRSLVPIPEKFIVEAPAVAGQSIDGPFAEVDRVRHCTSCHDVLAGAGERVAPALDGAGSKFMVPWLRQYLAAPWPIDVAEQARMPLLGLTESEIDTVTAFLSEATGNRTARDNAGNVVGLSDDEAKVGESLFRGLAVGDERAAVACIACHRTTTSPGGLTGPTLGGSPQRLAAEWVYTWLRDGRQLARDSRMPVQVLGHEEARALTAFILRQATSSSSSGGAAGEGGPQ
ncbi:MAG: c-type cytochrome [Planctomycetes bacterium]|nr:c-type cytochrome [Planctomycetota bacterium]